MVERESQLTPREDQYLRDQSQPASKPEPGLRPEHEPQSQAHAIRQDITQTRQRLDRTIDTLQLRLSPRYMAQQTMDKIKHESTRASHGFTHTVRENPLPAILSGIGLTWLIGASMRRGQQSEQGYAYRRPEDAELRARQSLYEAGLESQGSAYPPPSASQSYGQPGGESKTHAYAQQARDKAHEYGEQAREKAHAYGEQAREMASEYGHRAAETATHLRERASEVGHHMREQASETGERLRAGSQHAQETARDLFHDHPLSVGLGVMAAGMALGLLLPATRKENELLGEQRDHLWEQAQSYGSDLAKRGKAVAEHAVEAATEAAKEEASDQGLTSEDAASGKSASDKSSSNKSSGDSSSGTTSSPSSSSGPSASGPSASGLRSPS